MLVPYLTEYVLTEPGSEPRAATLIVASYFLGNFGLTPLWIRLSRQFGKRDVWLGSMMVSCLCFCGLFFLTAESTWAIYLVPFVLGASAGSGAVIAPSIKADVIDYDELQTGQRKEGSYLAVWNFIRKAAAGLAIGITGYALEFSGFVPNESQQSDAVILTLRSLFSWFPAACYAVGIVVAFRFRFDEAAHAEVRRQLEARR